jgi:DNA-binding CsgD family transcriptional regulator
MEVAAISSGSGEAIGSSLDRPGVLVFTSSFRLCYRDQRATELCEQIIKCESTKTVNGILPLAVTNLADEIHRLLRIRTESKDWEQFQIRRVAGDPNHPVLLCGFGVIEADMAQSRIVIVMQVTGSAFWHRRVLDRSKEKFLLTWREANILEHLLKGWTNKEIANTLNISEQTVKEHMKHLLAKIGVTTRTGIVMKAVLCGLHYETETFQSNSIESAFPLPIHAEA